MTALTLQACNGESARSEAEAFLDDFETALCGALTECSAYPDVATCRDVVFFREGAAQLLAAIDAGRVGFDAGKGRDCVALVAGFTPCEPFVEPAVIRQIEDTCDAAFTGTVQPGGDCFEDEECAGRAFCEPPAACDEECCVGSCAAAEPPPEPAEIGEPCDDAAAECVSGAYCRLAPGAETGVCAARVPAGERCEQFLACVEGAYCAFDPATLEGTCTVPPGEDEACDPEALIPCGRSALFCDPDALQCRRRPEPGSPCDAADVKSCVEFAVCIEGVCQLRPVEGQACALGTDLECLGDLECEASECVAPEAEPVCAYEP